MYVLFDDSGGLIAICNHPLMLDGLTSVCLGDFFGLLGFVTKLERIFPSYLRAHGLYEFSPFHVLNGEGSNSGPRDGYMFVQGIIKLFVTMLSGAIQNASQILRLRLK